MKFLLTFLSVFLSSVVVAQLQPGILWLKGYGGDRGDDVLKNVTHTTDGGFVIGISTNSKPNTGNIDSFCSGGSRAVFLKYNADASVLEWSKCYEDGDSQLWNMFTCADGGVVLGGDFGSGGFFICKHDVDGNIIWQQTHSKYNGLKLRAMIQTPNGGYLMTGICNNTDTNVIIHYGGVFTTDIFVLRLDSLGNKMWGRVIGGTQVDEPTAIVNGPEGGCYIIGYTSSNDYDCTGNHGGDMDIYLARLDSTGTLLWHHDIGGSGNDGPYGDAVSDGKGGVLITAPTTSTDGDVHHHIGRQDYWLADVDSTGKILWDNCYGSVQDEQSQSLCRAADGSIWITGQSIAAGGDVYTNYGNDDCWIVHTDSVGTLSGSLVIGSSKDDVGHMIHPLANGTVITGGLFSVGDNSFSGVTQYGFYDAFVTLLNEHNLGLVAPSSGALVGVWPNPASGILHISATSGLANMIVMNATGRVYYTGTDVFTNGSIDVHAWPRGLYILTATDRSGLRYISKLVLN